MNKQITTVSAKTMTALSQYPWPGNVRELENLIERAVILSRGSGLEVPLAELKQRTRAASEVVAAGLTTLQEAEREHILRALQEANWVISGPAGAAARLGVKRTTLQSKIQRFGIKRPK